MLVQTLEIKNGNTIFDNIMSDDEKITWGNVFNAPAIQITDNNHTHDDRYYRITDINSRISSLKIAISDLAEKVDLLEESL